MEIAANVGNMKKKGRMPGKRTAKKPENGRKLTRI